MKKSGLFKIILILIFVAAAITWFVSGSYYNAGELTELGIQRLGFFDFFSFVFSSFMFQGFLQVAIFILSIGGLYGVLAKTNAYRVVLEKIVKSLKGKETIFLVGIAFLLAGLSSALGFQLVMFIFIPALISIILLMGYSKFTAYLTTFGAVIIGMIGSTINNINLEINNVLGTTFSDNLLAKIGLFVISFILLMVFTLNNAKKEKKAKTKEEIVDLFLDKKDKVTKAKIKTWPIYALFATLFVLLVLSYTYWSAIFNVTIFSDALTKINELKLNGATLLRYLLCVAFAFGELVLFIFLISLIKAKVKVKTWIKYVLFAILLALLVLAYIYWGVLLKITIFSDALTKVNNGPTLFRYLLGDAAAFGEWTLFELTTTIFLLSLITGKICGVKAAESFFEGTKKLIKPVLFILFAYTVLYIAGKTFFYNSIISYVIGFTKHLSVAFTTLMISVGSLFHIDYDYTIYYVLSIYSATYTKAAELKTVALLAQSIYGLSMLVAPTSIMLILGLEYLEIPYKNWLKFIWKFVVALLVIILLIALIIRYL